MRLHIVPETLREKEVEVPFSGQFKTSIPAKVKTTYGHKFVDVDLSFTVSAADIQVLAEDAGEVLEAKPKKAPKESD